MSPQRTVTRLSATSVLITNVPAAKAASTSAWMPGPTGGRTQSRRHRRRSQPEVPIRRIAVQPADHHHVGIAPRGEIHRPLSQRRQRGVIDHRIDRAAAKRMRRAVEDRLQLRRLAHCAGTMSKKRVFMPFWFSYSDPCKRGRRQRQPDRRRREPRLPGLAGDHQRVERLDPAGKAEDRPSVRRAELEQQQSPVAVRNVRRRSVHRADMMHGDRAGLAGQGTALLKSTSRFAGSIAPQNTPSAWWSKVGPLWLPGMIISGPFSIAMSSNITPTAARLSLVWG